MADVVLVHPIAGESLYSTKSFMPLELIKLSTLVDSEYKVKIIDQRINRNWAYELRSELKKNPICVGITAMTGLQIKYGLKASEIVKQCSDVPVVWGGIHASLLPKQTLEDWRVDVVVKGEGEETFYELVNRLDKGSSLNGIRGVWYKNNGKIVANPDRPFLDLNKLPVPPYHLVNLHEYVKILELTTASMETSRGCPYRCTYCYNPAYNKGKYRELEAKNVLEQIKILYEEFGIEHIYFVDDNFYTNKKRVNDILRGILHEGYDIKFSNQGIRADNLNNLTNNELCLLEKAGSIGMVIGAESGSQRILDMLNKKITVEQLLAVNRKLKRTNLLAWYNFMVGYPQETEYDIQQTVNLMLRLIEDNKNAIITNVFCYSPYPGTQLYNLSVEHGFRPPDTLEGWSSFNWTNAELPWIPADRKKRLEAMNFCSLFLGKKESSSSLFYNLLIKLYKPVAKFRVKHSFFRFMVEKPIKEFICGDFRKW